MRPWPGGAATRGPASCRYGLSARAGAETWAEFALARGAGAGAASGRPHRPLPDKRGRGRGFRRAGRDLGLWREEEPCGASAPGRLTWVPGGDGVGEGQDGAAPRAPRRA